MMLSNIKVEMVVARAVCSNADSLFALIMSVDVKKLCSGVWTPQQKQIEGRTRV